MARRFDILDDSNEQDLIETDLIETRIRTFASELPTGLLDIDFLSRKVL